MPLYDLFCRWCRTTIERQCRVADRQEQRCDLCGNLMTVQIAPVYGKMAGQVVQGGGPDRFTADMMGIPLKELPDSLKTEPPK